ncbi:hypothetical protein [Methylobacterium adhaesivum]|uniref:Uncharacterized protein n=1 Tax=Methylobacterium adhaesivum TaxID=333297 RepID=A0ABT8BME6_9HYPH|nr:hypothetical protein [Methylobacterium adhaesivum]MDN3592403.1 hypothetical protein [Methylobacterium adhaesivum]
MSLLLLSAALARGARKKPETETEKDLVIEEYKSCRELIGRNIEIIERNEVYVIGACAVIIIFTIDKGNNLLTFCAAWLPLVLAYVGLRRYQALDSTIDLIDKYIEKQENTYKVIGYTSYYANRNPTHQLGKARLKVWTILIRAMIAFALYKSYAVINPLQDVCVAYPKIDFLCRPPDSAKDQN